MFQWFTELQAEVQVAIVALISAISVTMIPLFKNINLPASKTSSAEIAGALIDNTSIRELTISINELSNAIKNNSEKTAQNINELNDELSRLREEMIRNKKD